MLALLPSRPRFWETPPTICVLHLHRKGLWLPQLVCKGRGAQRTVWDCSIMTLWEISPSSY